MPSTLAAKLPQPFSRGCTFAQPEHLLGKNSESIRDVTDINPSLWNAAGAIHSTLGDLRKFARAVGRGDLVSPASFAIQTDWNPTPWSDHEYGFLTAKIHGLIGHDGDVPGYSSFIGYRPHDDTTVIALTNIHGRSIGGMPANQIAAELAALY